MVGGQGAGCGDGDDQCHGPGPGEPRGLLDGGTAHGRVGHGDDVQRQVRGAAEQLAGEGAAEQTADEAGLAAAHDEVGDVVAGGGFEGDCDEVGAGADVDFGAELGGKVQGGDEGHGG